MPPLVPTPLLVPSRPIPSLSRPATSSSTISTVDPGRQSQARSDESEAALTQRERASSSSVDATAGSGQRLAGDASAGTEPAGSTSTRADQPSPAPGVARSIGRIREPELELGARRLRRLRRQHSAAVDDSAATAAGSRSAAAPADRRGKAGRAAGPAGDAAAPASERGQARSTAGDAAAAGPRAASGGGSASHGISGSPRPAADGPPAPVQTQTAGSGAGRRSATRLSVWPGDLRLAAADGPSSAAPRFLSLFFVEEKHGAARLASVPARHVPDDLLRALIPKPYPVLAAPQADDVKPSVATQTAKKPCVLTVWFQKMQVCGQGSGCSGCHHGGSAPCCSGCTCHAGKNKSVAASPQASLASPQGDAAIAAHGPSSQAAPIGSTGTKPGDVAEEGKLFERVSFDSFDKSPQS